MRRPWPSAPLCMPASQRDFWPASPARLRPPEEALADNRGEGSGEDSCSASNSLFSSRSWRRAPLEARCLYCGEARQKTIESWAGAMRSPRAFFSLPGSYTCCRSVPRTLFATLYMRAVAASTAGVRECRKSRRLFSNINKMIRSSWYQFFEQLEVNKRNKSDPAIYKARMQIN